MFRTNAKRLVAGSLLALAAISSPSFAATLSFSPAASSAVPGGGFDVDLLISDLGTSQLGSFDFVINYDPAVLSFGTYDLGSQLGNLGLGEAFDLSTGATGSGTLHLGEVSFLADLSSQASSFSLATLHFTVSGSGSSALGYGNVTLGDALGNSLDATLTAGSVAAVPEPETYAMFLAGLGLMGAIARRRRA